MRARTASILVVALVACGGSTDPGPADIIVGPIDDFAPNTVSLVHVTTAQGELDGYLIRIDDRVALFELSDPNSGCPLSPISTGVDRPADIPIDSVFFESCQGNAYTIDGALVAGSGSANLESLPLHLDQGVVIVDVITQD